MTDCRSGKTPLHLAMACDCNKTSMEVCRILSNCNIDKQLKDGKGKLAMDYGSKEDERLQFLVIKCPKMPTQSQVSVKATKTESCKEKPSHEQKKKAVETHEERKKTLERKKEVKACEERKKTFEQKKEIKERKKILEQKKEVKTCEERKKTQKDVKTHEQKKKEIKSQASQKGKGCKVSLLL